MNVNQTASQIVQVTVKYEAFLATLSDIDFQQNPAVGVWSYAEVYSHIFEANLLSLLALEKCIKGAAEEDNKRTHFAVLLILFLGKFPPGKIKAPAHIAALVKKVSRAEAQQLLTDFRKRFQDLLPMVSQASATQKAKHPKLGMLNARQWLRFIGIHTQHHQKQLIRIQKALQ